VLAVKRLKPPNFDLQMIKIGIVGANESSRRHIMQLKLVPDFEIVGLFDHDVENARLLADEFQIPFFETLQDMLNRADAVDIASPVGTHFKYASQSIMQSVHVLLNGLLSEDIREAKQLNDLAIEANVCLKILHEEKFHPEIKALRRLVKKPTYIECNRFKNKVLSISNDSIIFGMVLLDVDLLISIVGSNVRKVVSNASKVFNEYADFINVRIEFENGCIANINCGNFEKADSDSISVYQKNELITLDLEKFDLTKLVKTDSGDYKEQPVNQSRTKIQDVVKLELEDFAQAILSRKRITQDTYQSYQSLRIAHQIIEKLHPSTLFDA
jgi:predicted dehydrogenase